jgi:site-specific DNA-methyltransferase (adenine-specific)
MSNLRIENISIASLACDSGNARKHDQKNLDAIESSLRLFGQRKPIVVTGANIVVAGNGTLEAAKNMGWEKIDVVRIPSDWTPEQVKAYALADNRTAELAEWDSSILAQQLLELDAVGWDLKELGFETLEPPTDIEILEQDEIPELPINPVSKLGDVWQLGRHRLMCGDSTKEKDVAKLMNDEVADLVVTDPPYNVAIENSAGLTIKNDDMENTKFQEFLTSCFKRFQL